MKTLAIAAAAVLLSAGLAAAQTDAPAPGSPPEASPPAAAPADSDARGPGMGAGRPDWARGEGKRGEGMRGEGKKMHPRGGPHGHHGGMMMRPSKGASFVFAAPGQGRIMIKCADEDSTQACADAVRPMLELMLQAGGGQ